jgi:hypothetical protein
MIRNKSMRKESEVLSLSGQEAYAFTNKDGKPLCVIYSISVSHCKVRNLKCYNEIWNNEEFLLQCKESTILLIYKNGNKTD